MATPEQEASTLQDAQAVITVPPLTLNLYNFLTSQLGAAQLSAVLLSRLVLAVEAAAPAGDPGPAIVAAITIASAANVAAIEAAAAAIIAALPGNH